MFWGIPGGSRLTSTSARSDHSWQGWGHQMGCQGSNPSCLRARQVLYPLYCCSGPLQINGLKFRMNATNFTRATASLLKTGSGRAVGKHRFSPFIYSSFSRCLDAENGMTVRCLLLLHGALGLIPYTFQKGAQWTWAEVDPWRQLWFSEHPECEPTNPLKPKH